MLQCNFTLQVIRFRLCSYQAATQLQCVLLLLTTGTASPDSEFEQNLLDSQEYLNSSKIMID